MGITILPDGELLDKTVINNSRVHCFKIDNGLLELNDIFNRYKSMVVPGLYLNNSLHPFIQSNTIIDNTKGRYVISTVNDFVNYILEDNEYKADEILITKNNIGIIKKYISTVSKSNLLIVELLRFLEADLMINENVEHELLFKDIANMSNHVLLENHLFKVYDNIVSYIFYIFNININLPELDDFLNKVEDVYSELRKTILNSLTNNYLYNSVSIKLTNMSITVTEYAPPSSRRYNINKDILSDIMDEDDGVIDINEEVIKSLGEYEKENAKDEEDSYGGTSIYS